MIIPTPTPSPTVLQHLESDNYRDRPILKNYPDYEVCFLSFQPFLKIKSENQDKIHFVMGKWPDKKAIVQNCDRLTWTDFLAISNISDYKKLNHALNFMHTAIRHGDRDVFDKLINFASIDKQIIPPQPDYFPEILEDRMLSFIKSKKYDNIFVYNDTDLDKKLTNINTLINSDHLPYHVRLQTPDNKYLIVTDFDCCFSYFLGPKTEIQEIVDNLDLEGFYCNSQTTEFWSYDEVPIDNRINWDYIKTKKTTPNSGLVQ